MKKTGQATGIYARRLAEDGHTDIKGIRPKQPRAGELDIWKKRPQPCAYGCGRSVYTIYAVAMCNVCRRQKGIPVWNE